MSSPKLILSVDDIDAIIEKIRISQSKLEQCDPKYNERLHDVLLRNHKTAIEDYEQLRDEIKFIRPSSSFTPTPTLSVDHTLITALRQTIKHVDEYIKDSGSGDDAA